MIRVVAAEMVENQQRVEEGDEEEEEEEREQCGGLCLYDLFPSSTAAQTSFCNIIGGRLKITTPSRAASPTANISGRAEKVRLLQS